MTKVVQLQYKLSPSGDFARRYHQEYIKAGIDSSILSLYTDISLDENIRSLGAKERYKAKLNNEIQARYTRGFKSEYGLFSYPIMGTNVAKLQQIQEADVIILHWVLHGFLSIKNMEQLAQTGKPIIFILHDMWSITGGCHYAADCTKYHTGCSACPMFERPREKDLAAAEFKKKMAFYSKYDNLYFVSPSKWMADCANDSALTKNKPVYHIPNFLDHQVFKAYDQSFAREVLNIGKDETVLAFGAVSMDSPFKGWQYLKNALDLLHKKHGDQNISVLVFGGANNGKMVEAIPFKTRSMGRVLDEYAMSLIYNSADIFIAPSLSDNLPYTIFESLSCGTQVVAFDVGGIPDMVKHKQNGYLAAYKNTEDLVRGIEFCIEQPMEGRIPPALETAVNVKRHVELFDELLNNRQPRKAHPLTEPVEQ